MDNPKSNPGNPGHTPNPFEQLIGSCAEASVKLGGTPKEIAKRTFACGLLKLVELGFPADPADPPAPGDAKPAPSNPGSPAK